MSRKSKRNRPSEPTAGQPQVQAGATALAAPAPAPAEGNAAKVVAIVIAVVTLAIALVLTVKLVADKDKPTTEANATRILALASTQAPSLGADDARVHIVEFMDPACETCAVFYPQVKKIMAENPGKIRLTVRHVAFHKNADEAVRVLEGARAQGKYFETLEALLANQEQWVDNHRVVAERIPAAVASVGLDMARLRNDMNAMEVTQRMALDMDDARALTVTKTPEYFVNGRQMSEFGMEELRKLIGEELRRAYP